MDPVEGSRRKGGFGHCDEAGLECLGTIAIEPLTFGVDAVRDKAACAEKDAWLAIPSMDVISGTCRA